jgi:PAS domain-containing protein
MYFKISMRHNPAKGKIDGYCRLVESYRNAEDRVCHRTLLNVGFLDGVATVDQLNLIQKYLNRRVSEVAQGKLFSEEKDDDALVNEFVEALWERLVNGKRMDTGEPPSKGIRKKDRGLVYIDSIRHKDVRETGPEWVSCQALEQLKPADFPASQGREESDIRPALTRIISRAVYPASELETSRWIRENPAVCELTGYPVEEITKDRLYYISLRLYQIHEALEQYLSLRTGDLIRYRG